MSHEIDQVSRELGDLSATTRIILANQETRNRVDADFRREMRAALEKLAPASELAQVRAMAENTKARLDRARATLGGAAFILSALGYTVADKLREFFGSAGGHH